MLLNRDNSFLHQVDIAIVEHHFNGRHNCEAAVRRLAGSRGGRSDVPVLGSQSQTADRMGSGTLS
jgi:hypothetical protein